MSIVSALSRKLFGPKTIYMSKIKNPCEICQSPDCHIEMYVDSDNLPEMMVVKCPKCGPIKTLTAGRYHRPEPRYERNYAEWLTGAFRKPKMRKEI
jgi:hypothetical protein